MNSALDVSSIAGVIIATSIVLQTMKSWCCSTPIIKNIPMVVLAVFVALFLSLMAHAAGMLDGPLGVVLAKTVLAALGSSGLYSAMSGSSTQALHKADDGKNDKPGKLNFAWVLALCLLLPMMGCQQIAQMFTHQDTTAGQLQSAKLELTAILTAAADARDAGLIKQSDIDPYKPYVDTAKLSLELWSQAIARGDTPGQSAAQKQWNDVAIVLRALRAQIVPKPPATRPSTRPASGVSYGNSSNVDVGGAFGHYGRQCYA